MNQAEITKLRTLISETQKAREALEAKGAFVEANAATHIVLALEALIEGMDLEGHLQVAEALQRGDTNN